MAEPRAKLLIVDDEFNTREALIRFLGKKFDVTGAENGSAAIEQLQHNDFDLILTDLRMPEADGMSVLDAAMSKARRPQCILLTAYGSISDAVTAMKKGAFDFVTKPVKLARLESVIDAALKAGNSANKIEEEITGDASPAPSQIRVRNYDKTVLLPQNENDPMRKVLNTALTIAPAKSTVLLTGESGTGKETIAMFIHTKSPRKNEPFCTFNCASVTPNLLEDRFFGHEKGAFTGANEQKKGLFEIADGGTLFLDEIGEMPLEAQGVLLRVLEGGRFTRVGGTDEISVDVRLITATNRDLAELVREGKFREDLYHRLCVVLIHAPSLREHKEDIEQIANGRWLKEHHRRLETEQIAVLKTYDYPGNVRELINILDRAIVLDESDFAKLLKEHKEMTAGLKPSNEKSEAVPDELDVAVRLHVKRVYEKYDRNLTRTAEALKAARNTVKKYLED